MEQSPQGSIKLTNYRKKVVLFGDDEKKKGFSREGGKILNRVLANDRYYLDKMTENL